MNNTLFNSSAGTGKTFRLTDVYIKLITEIKIDPNKIILMTFSRNTAFELKSEVLFFYPETQRLKQLKFKPLL